MSRGRDRRGPRDRPRGGYSYAAASFGGGSLVVDMTRLDRVLRFEPLDRRIEIEAGMRALESLTGEVDAVVVRIVRERAEREPG